MMGCSYDPTPHTIYPSPQDLWMEENGFSSVKVDYHYIGSTCHSCGVIMVGNKHAKAFLLLHLSTCAVKARAEIPEKTEEECKAFPRTVYS